MTKGSGTQVVRHGAVRLEPPDEQLVGHPGALGQEDPQDPAGAARGCPTNEHVRIDVDGGQVRVGSPAHPASARHGVHTMKMPSTMCTKRAANAIRRHGTTAKRNDTPPDDPNDGANDAHRVVLQAHGDELTDVRRSS